MGILRSVILLVLLLGMNACGPESAATAKQSTVTGEWSVATAERSLDKITSIDVNFHEAKTSSIEEIQRDALVALNARGLNPSPGSECRVRLNLLGHEPNCVVSFYDSSNSVVFGVMFDQRGAVKRVNSSRMHYSPVPGEKPREIPKGGTLQGFRIVE
jgi:hypothetical protein